MKGSLTYRLTWQFAALVALTTAVVLAAGGWLLRHQAVRGMELMHELQGKELAELLGKNGEITSAEIHRRIKEAHDSDMSLYFIQVHNEQGAVLYRSENLGDAILPDLSTSYPHWTASLPGIGVTRVSEFYSGPWHIQIGSPFVPVDRLMRDYAQMSGFLVLGAGLAGVGLGFGFSRATLRPVRAIEQTARRIGADNLRERIPVQGKRDELAGLTSLLNQMFDRLEGSFEQVRRFTADASHELKTPLALIRLNAERLRARLVNDPEAVAGLADLMEEVSRMNRIIESLLFIAKAESGALSLQMNEHDVSALLKPFAEDARVLAEDRGVRFELAKDDAGSAKLEPALMRQLLLNLVANALNVSPPDGIVTLESVRTEQGWRLCVMDEGPGLPPEQLEAVFERFVRFESANIENRRHGHGLGLAICRSIVELHGGSIHAENRDDGRSGLRVLVELPVVRATGLNT
ncbi:MAG: ATP-binding protein [Opitutaceae bacterium]|jgi:signal transduction histidine kinase